MRTTADRIRHMLIFELLAIAMVTPAAMWVTGDSLGHIGVLAIAMSVLAMAWNYIYNLAFDRWLLRARGSLQRSLATRVVHALGFEGGLVIVGVPIIAWWLGTTLWQALLLDIGFVLFFLGYAFVYNWVYDLLFPLSGHKEPAAQKQLSV